MRNDNPAVEALIEKLWREVVTGPVGNGEYSDVVGHAAPLGRIAEAVAAVIRRAQEQGIVPTCPVVVGDEPAEGEHVRVRALLGKREYEAEIEIEGPPWVGLFRGES